MALAESLREAVADAEPRHYECAGGDVIAVKPASILRVMEFLKGEPSPCFDLLVDITAVDRVASKGTLEVVYQLCSIATGERVMVKAEVPVDAPSLPSVTPLWRNANWAEREVWDMFGVHFQGHPDLRRILLYEEFVGHPLRKDYPYNKRQPLVPERDPINDPWPVRGSKGEAQAKSTESPKTR